MGADGIPYSFTFHGMLGETFLLFMTGEDMDEV